MGTVNMTNSSTYQVSSYKRRQSVYDWFKARFNEGPEGFRSQLTTAYSFLLTWFRRTVQL